MFSKPIEEIIKEYNEKREEEFRSYLAEIDKHIMRENERFESTMKTYGDMLEKEKEEAEKLEVFEPVENSDSIVIDDPEEVNDVYRDMLADIFPQKKVTEIKKCPLKSTEY